jgi:Prolyl oligopeptidase family
LFLLSCQIIVLIHLFYVMLSHPLTHSDCSICFFPHCSIFASPIVHFFPTDVHTLTYKKYWEPAKFVATLRHKVAQDPDKPICLKMDLSAGHFSASDRYKYYEEQAFYYTFLLQQLGILPKNTTSSQK